jgi:transcriptional regulator with XRE-family HTH domain
MDQSDEPLQLKDLVNFLFDTIRRPDGEPYSLYEVADAIDISPATIHQLRTGRIKSPTLPTLKEIGRFFNVPLSFFECESIDACYQVLGAQGSDLSPGVSKIAFRASKLSEKSQLDLLKIIAWVEAAERERKAGRDPSDFPLAEDQDD